ncbi:MAG TPA: hypothetical protein VHC04_15975 [Rhodopila sp.]|nr:hypothetical protein [Rhodopila sp.]
MLSPATLAGLASGIARQTSVAIQRTSLAPVGQSVLPAVPPRSVSPAPTATPASPASPTTTGVPPRGLPRGTLLDISV